MTEKVNGKRSNFKCNDITIDRIAFNRILKQVAPSIEKYKDSISIALYFGTNSNSKL